MATTGLAALRLGRRFLGIELSEKYAEMARRKLQRWWEDTRLVETEVPEAQAVLPLAPQERPPEPKLGGWELLPESVGGCPPCKYPDHCPCDAATGSTDLWRKD